MPEVLDNVEGYRFGLFEVHLAAGEVRKNGLKLKLQEQPFQALVMLLERAPQVVLREDLRKRLWSDGTFVDFDHSLSIAINRIREVLGDSADNARFIETLPKRGYRFIAPVERIPGTQERRPPEERRNPRWIAIAAVGLCVVLALGAGWWRLQHFQAPLQIAVLPLINLSQDPANDYLADGLTSEVIRNLSIIEGLTVRSQTSSFVFKGKPQSVQDAARQLNVDYILEGSVLCVGQRLRINAQFIRVRDDSPLWSGRYDRDVTDIFAVQDEISRGIVNSLRLKLGRGRRRYETNAEAYDLYLRAISLGRGAAQLAGFAQSIPVFEQAIAKDPSFAPAYAGLAEAYVAISGNNRYDIQGALAKLPAAAEKAVQLDPLSAESHDAMGAAQARQAQWEQSRKSFLRAIEIEPNRSDSHTHFAIYYLLPLGRIEDAIQQLRIAEANNPLSPEVHFWLGDALADAGRNREAVGECVKLTSDSQNKNGCIFGARTRDGQAAEVIQALQSVPDQRNVAGALGCAYARSGRPEEAQRLMSTASGLEHIVLIAACLGAKDRVFEALDHASDVGPVRMGCILNRVNRENAGLLRGDPRLQALRKKVGLPTS